MDRMLHRGEYASVTAGLGDAPLVPRRRVWLGKQKINPLDDGTVVGHQNLDEQALIAQVDARDGQER